MTPQRARFYAAHAPRAFAVDVVVLVVIAGSIAGSGPVAGGAIIAAAALVVEASVHGVRTAEPLDAYRDTTLADQLVAIVPFSPPVRRAVESLLDLESGWFWSVAVPRVVVALGLPLAALAGSLIT